MAGIGQNMDTITNAHLNRFFNQQVTLSRDEIKICTAEVMTNVVSKILDHINQIDPGFEKAVFHGGSYWQGLKVDRPDEYDLEVRLKDLDKEITWGNSQPRCYQLIDTNPQKQQPAPGSFSSAIKVVPSPFPLPNIPRGYALLSLGMEERKMYETSSEATNLAYEGDLIPFLVRRRLKQLLGVAIHALRLEDCVRVQKKAHGPALTLVVDLKDPRINYPVMVDLAPTAAVIVSFPHRIQWPHPGAKWPSADKVEEIRQIGVNLVAKKDLFWQVSYAEAEKQLVRGIDQDGGCRKKVLRMVKYLNDKFWHDNNRPLLSSYIIKNVWFLECEKYWSSLCWEPEKLSERFLSMITEIHHALSKKSLQQYFDPTINLLEGKDPHDISLVIKKIGEFLACPSKFMQG